MSAHRLLPVAFAVLVASGALSTGCSSTTVTDPPLHATSPNVTGTTLAPSAPSGVEVGTGVAADDTVQAQPAPGSCRYTWVGDAPLPDRRCTPGATDPQVSPADIDSTICRPGWTAGVRPPERVTASEKRGSAAAYGYGGSFATAEYDHLVPLELGGSPNDPANLWVEPNDDARATSTFNGKDRVEDALHADVCAGRVPLAEAQAAMATNWVAAAARYGG